MKKTLLSGFLPWAWKHCRGERRVSLALFIFSVCICNSLFCSVVKSLFLFLVTDQWVEWSLVWGGGICACLWANSFIEHSNSNSSTWNLNLSGRRYPPQHHHHHWSSNLCLPSWETNIQSSSHCPTKFPSPSILPVYSSPPPFHLPNPGHCLGFHLRLKALTLIYMEAILHHRSMCPSFLKKSTDSIRKMVIFLYHGRGKERRWHFPSLTSSPSLFRWYYVYFKKKRKKILNRTEVKKVSLF